MWRKLPGGIVTLLPHCIRCARYCGATTCTRRERRFDPVGREGHGTQPDTGGVEDGVRQSGRYGYRGSFAGTDRRQRWPVEEGHFNRRDFRKGQNPVAHPVHPWGIGDIASDFLV